MNRTAVYVCATAALTIAPGFAWAQTEAVVHGNVVAADGSRLPQATVTLKSTSTGEDVQTTADASGRFIFSRVRADQYVLAASSEGFMTREVHLILEPREVRAVTLSLDVAGLNLSVEVTAAPVLPSIHSPSSSVLTSDRLEALPPFQRTSLPDAIVTSAPGMIRGHDDFVHIRGHEVALNPSVNGVQFWENAHAVFSPGLGVDYIESINVMTGGFPAEYGNRFGGILDVVTKSGFTFSNRGSITLGVGSAQRHNAGLELGGRKGRIAYYVNLTGFMSDRFLSPPSPRSIHNAGRGLRSFGRVDFRATESNEIKLVMMGDGVNFDLPMDERDELLRPDFKNVQRARSESMILSWDHVRSAEAVAQATLYQRWSGVRQFPESSDRYGAQPER